MQRMTKSEKSVYAKQNKIGFNFVMVKVYVCQKYVTYKQRKISRKS